MATRNGRHIAAKALHGQKRRLLIASHSHPQVSTGGSEIAAYQLYSALEARGGHESWFLGCTRDGSGKLGASMSQPFGPREFIYSAGAFDWFNFANQDPAFPQEFSALLERIKPDVVHFHHYINFGVEAFLTVRRVVPRAQIVLTLHEYLAICNYFGQMVTKADKALCYEATPIACSKCFSDRTPSDFFLRERYLKRFLALVDCFVAPSNFLAARYAAWGIPSDRIHVIENVISPTADPPKRVERSKSDPLRIGFFGQVSLLKGINVLMEAAAILEEEGTRDVSFEIFGNYIGQPPEFQADFLARLAKVGRNVKFRGPYDRTRVDSLMQSVDAVLVPSIWWENSPVVIQEAFRNRRPVLCSDIGGMAEKVRDGPDGFHFPVGNSVALASLVRKINKDRSLLGRAAKTIQLPAAATSIVDAHVKLYNSLSEAANSRSSR